jgi:23S rRNA pseudouridine1911/1915/1917 synthase
MPQLVIDQTFQIEADRAGERLDRFLADRFVALSRSQLQKCIARGESTVNGKTAVAHYRLRVGDQVVIKVEEAPTITPKPWSEIRLIAETNDHLIIEKPSGILVHTTPTTHEKTLIDWLVENYPEISSVGDDPTRPGIVHRLDRGVSGLMVVARTQEAFLDLKSQFQSRTIEKTYLALVHGVIDHDGEIALSISRSRSDRRKMVARPDNVGRPAKTTYTIEQSFPHFTLLRVHPETGRMHQIRVHLRAIGHPIVGDALYASRNIQSTHIDRPVLHSTAISFTDRSGRRQTYVSPLPPELAQFLAGLDGPTKRQ